MIERERGSESAKTSPEFAKQLVTNLGREEVPPTPRVHKDVKKAAFKGSQAERTAVSHGSFGENMMVWLNGIANEGKQPTEGMAEWIEGVMQPNNLTGEALLRLFDSQDQQPAMTLQNEVTPLVERINQELTQPDKIEITTISESQLLSLALYHKYLDSGEAAAENRFQELTNRLTSFVEEGAPQTRLQRVQAISPLLNVLGEKTRQAVTAMIEVDAGLIDTTTISSASDTIPSQREQEIVAFLHQHHPNQEVREEQKNQNVLPNEEREPITPPLPNHEEAASNKTVEGESEQAAPESEIRPSGDLLDRFSKVPEFYLSDLESPMYDGLTKDQKEQVRQLIADTSLSSPVTDWVDLETNTNTILQRLRNPHPFFGYDSQGVSNHERAVPPVYMFVGEDRTIVNPTLPAGEQIFPGQENFFTGLAALIATQKHRSQSRDPRQTAEIEASAGLALADGILRTVDLLNQQDSNYLYEYIYRQVQNNGIYLIHDYQRYTGETIAIDRTGQIDRQQTINLFNQKDASGLYLIPIDANGHLIPRSGNPNDALFIFGYPPMTASENTSEGITKEVRRDDLPLMLLSDTYRHLLTRIPQALEEIHAGQLSPQTAMLVEFLGNGLYVTEVAKIIASQQRQKTEQSRPDTTPGPDAGPKPEGSTLSAAPTAPASRRVIEKDEEAS